MFKKLPTLKEAIQKQKYDSVSLNDGNSLRKKLLNLAGPKEEKIIHLHADKIANLARKHIKAHQEIKKAENYKKKVEPEQTTVQPTIIKKLDVRV